MAPTAAGFSASRSLGAVPRTDSAVRVVAAVITRRDGRVLISLRSDEADQGGLWEFPGGKLEPGETVLQALTRELEEELGIGIRSAHPFLKLRHKYPTKEVRLHVYCVSRWYGEPAGREGQQLAWVTTAQLKKLRFPAANTPIIGILGRRTR